MFLRNRHPYLEQAADVPAGAGGGGSGASAGADPAAGGSLLSQGGTPAEVPLNEFVPEKFRAMRDDNGTQVFDAEATLRKVTQSYVELEKHKGAIPEVPKSAEEYAPKIEVEGFDMDAFKADPMTASFLKGAHAKGMTNDQVSYVLQSYFQSAPELVQAAKNFDRGSCEKSLRETWADEAAFKQNLSGAWKSFQTYAEKAGVTVEEAEASGIANNPIFLRLMASIAPELQEDPGVHPGDASPTGESDINALLVSEAYMNPKHPEHQNVSQKVQRYYQSKFKGAAL